MTDVVELIHDGEGLAVIGDLSAVDRFLDSVGLLSLSQELRFDSLGSALDTGSKMAEVAADIAENAGRYIKLTKESAGHVKEFGFMPTKTEGISHAMLGDPGSISKWIQIEDNPAALLMNPAVLTGVAGIMAQLARQQEAKEFKKLLLAIDEKLDDVRRKQRDDVLAKMYRVGDAIREANAIREHGGDGETLWDKVQSESGMISEVQRSAVLAIGALADKADEAAEKTGVRALAAVTQEIEAEVGVWLDVLVRCFQLQQQFADLEIDHVRITAPLLLDGHRRGKRAALQETRNEIVSTTTQFLARLDDVGGVAQSKLVLHSRAARTVVNSINTVGGSIEEFHVPFAIEAPRQALTNTPWADAVRDAQQLRTAAAEAAPKVGAVVGAAAAVGAVARRLR